MLTIMISKTSWDEMWELANGNPSLTLNERVLFDRIESVHSMDAAKKCLGFLRNFGLVDPKSGHLTKLGKRWADSKTYSAVCQELILSQYPEGSEPILGDNDLSRKEKALWLMEKEGMKSAGAEKNASFFSVLIEGAKGKLPKPKEMCAARPSKDTVGKEGANRTSQSITITISSQTPADEIASILKAISSSLSESELTIAFTA